MKFFVLLFLLCLSLVSAQRVPLLFEGNEQISARELYTSLNLYKPYFYEFYRDAPAVLPKTLPLLVQALEEYYRSRGYFHAEVIHAKKENAIVISVKEGAPVLVEDVALISTSEIGRYVPFVRGDVFDSAAFTQSKQEIKDFYADKSYCNVQLDAKAWVDIETNYAYIVYETTPNAPCYFGDVEIIPSKNIEAKIIESLLYIKEGAPYMPNKITKSYENLYGHEGISKALIETQNDENSSVKTKVSVSENEKPVRFQAGVGVSSDEGAMASLGVKHRNLYGNLKTAGLSLRATQVKQSVKTNFDMPLENRNATGTELGFENENLIGYKESRTFGALYLKQNNNPHSFKESLLFESTNTYGSEDELLFEEGNLFVISPKLEWSYDERDKILDPSHGHFINSEISGSLLSALSDASYYKFKLSGGYIHPLAHSIVALKASFGSLHLYQGSIPESYRFYAGGMHSNRAYGYRKLSPTSDSGEPMGSDSLLETTLEYRFPIYGDFKGVVFNDNTYLGERAVPEYSQGYCSAGAGLRYKTPIGAIAIDFGFDLANPKEQYAFHFHVGELF